MLITAADSQLFQWDVTNGNVESPLCKWDVNAALSGSANGIDSNSDRISYGGPRNPDHQVFIFDAKISPSNQSIVSVALSDGTVRQIDLRCRSLLDGGCRSSLAGSSASASASATATASATVAVAGAQQESNSSTYIINRNTVFSGVNNADHSNANESHESSDHNADALSTVSFTHDLLRESHFRSPQRSPTGSAPPVHVTSVSIACLCTCYQTHLSIFPTLKYDSYASDLFSSVLYRSTTAPMG
jgi:hypothetical protein